jgi:hypothetical protein
MAKETQLNDQPMPTRIGARLATARPGDCPDGVNPIWFNFFVRARKLAQVAREREAAAAEANSEKDEAPAGAGAVSEPSSYERTRDE